ncbi:hypothetical protein [uncultured Anaerococcus sp.]|uniref:hypothetical protein n=1 Tax=uncultured Anaerococcus sp. TaxID=293428 RepID=UPI002889007C|nr:hypothetical protein [uncultured Anaerococcus sp.]
MKRALVITLLALGLVACDKKDLDDPRVKEALNQAKLDVNTEDDSVSNEEEKQDKQQEDEEINRTYPEDEVKKDVISVEKSAKKDNEDKEEKKKLDKTAKEKEYKKKSDKSKKDSDKKSKEDRKEPGKEDEKDLTEDDIFFSNYDLVTIRGGEVCSALTDLRDYSENFEATYVPFSNNIFVLGSYDDKDFSIKKINGEDLTLLYDFKDHEDFRPKGMIGDKIYGIYYDNRDDTVETDKNQSGLAYVDLKTGKLNIYEATKYKYEIVDQVAVTDKEILFTKFNKYQKTELYKLDPAKGLDQKAELLEKNTDQNYLFSAKYFEDGKAKYEIFKSSDGYLKIKDVTYKLSDRVSFIGQNMITCQGVKFDKAKHLFKMDIVNYLTGETIEKDLETYGYRVYKGKLYYIDYDKKVQSLDIGL